MIGKTIVVNELKKNIEGLLKIKEQLALQYGTEHENVCLIEKSIEAMKTEALTKLHIYALKNAMKNSRSFEDSFDANELIDFLENIFDEDARTFSEFSEEITTDSDEREI